MSYLPRLGDPADRLTLMPNSGIQFFDTGFDIEKLDKVRQSYWEQLHSENSVQLFKVRRDEASNGYAIDGHVDALGNARMPPAEEVYTVKAADAAETFNRVWIPLPVFAVNSGRDLASYEFFEGPTTWARIYVAKLDKPDERGNSHRVVVAFDTALRSAEQHGVDRPYLAPLDGDWRSERAFALTGRDDPKLAFFVNLSFVRPVLREAFVAAERARWIAKFPDRDPTRFDPTPRPGRTCKEAADYLTLVELLDKSGCLPTFFFPIQNGPAVKVDLVLDIGNSRACGILIERRDEAAHPTLEDSYRLELRDLSRPERVYRDAFPSRVEFAMAHFGDERLAARSGRADAFRWHAIVRTGVEATDLCISAKGGEGATGLSSPKRYLWDEARQVEKWRFNMSLHPNGGAGAQIVDHPAMMFMTEKGEVISALEEKDRAKATEAWQPHFSRCSLFTLLLQEILQHAFVQINSINSRRLRFDERPRRVLDKIVLTLPPGMSLPERRRFSERANAAVHLLWDCLAAQSPGSFVKPAVMKGAPLMGAVPPAWGQGAAGAVKMPTVAEPYDEASSTQLVFLYSEVRRLHNGVTDLLATYGRTRTVHLQTEGRVQQRESSTVRIASIDIGGGTTDLMVITHEVLNRTHVIPHQNFRESFRFAGDDLLREIVKEFVLPAIEALAEQNGIRNGGALTTRLFGPNIQLSEPQRQRRRRLVTEIIEPVAVEILKTCAEGEAIDTIRPIRDFFPAGWEPTKAAVDYVTEEIKQLGAQPFDLMATPLKVDSRAVEKLVFELFRPFAQNLCEVIRDLDCDLVLLSGRPSRLPVITQVLLSELPVPPSRLINMSGYRVGSWYPFSDQGFITDPKTPTAVGAALTWLAQGDLGGMRFESKNLRQRSTARFVGTLEEAGMKLPNASVVIGDLDLDQKGNRGVAGSKLIMLQRQLIGYRQLPIERWPATPLYELTFKSGTYTVPAKLGFQRKEPERDDMDVREVEDFDIDRDDIQPLYTDAELLREPSRGDFELKLLTLPSRSGYWLDTGEIK